MASFIMTHCVPSGTCKIKRYAPYFLFAIAALNVFSWFPSGAPIGWGDAGLTMYGANASTLFHATLSPWNGLSQVGLRSAAQMTLLPQALYFDIGSHFGVAPSVAEGLYFFLIQFVGMTAVFSVARRLGAGRISLVGAILSALLYNFAPLTFENYWMIGNASIILVALTPLALLVALRLPEKGVIRGSLEVILVEYFCFAAFQDPAYFLPVLFLTAAVSLLASVRAGRTCARSGGLLLACITSVAAAAWFVLPDLSQLNSFFHQATAEASPRAYLAAADQNVNLHSLLELRAFRTGSPAFASYWAPAWRIIYGEPAVQVLGLFFLTIILLAVGAAVRHGDWVFVGLFFLGIAGLFLCLGGNPPAGALYRWLFSHIPYFAGFRDPTNKWTPWLIIPSALLFGYGWSWLVKLCEAGSQIVSMPKLRSPTQLLLGLAMGALVLGYGFPMFTGGPGDPRISGPTFALKRGIRPPRSFAQARRFLLAQPGWFRVLVVPLSLSGYRWFRWPRGYDGPDLSWLQFGVPSLSSPYSQPISDGGRFLFTMASTSTEGTIQLAEELGCRYVLAEGDAVGTGLSYFTPPRPSASTYVTAAERLGGKVVLKEGLLTLLLMPERDVAPLVSVVSLSGRGTGEPLSMAPADSQGSVDSIHGSFVLPHGLDVVMLRDAYDVQWHLNVTSLAQRKGSIVVERHTMFDGYGNAWLVRVSGDSSGVKVTAAFTYEGSRLRNLGALISAITVFGLLILQLVKKYRRYPERRLSG